MREKFNVNKFESYRKAIAVAGSANIRRIHIWDKQKQRYVDPIRGNKYEARQKTKATLKRETCPISS